MATISVKLPDAVKARVDDAAASRGMSPHAFMVAAIEEAASQDELQRSFVEDALQARTNVLRSGQVYAGEEVASYFRAKLAGKPATAPRARKLASYKKPRGK